MQTQINFLAAVLFGIFVSAAVLTSAMYFNNALAVKLSLLAAGAGYVVQVSNNYSALFYVGLISWVTAVGLNGYALFLVLFA